MGHGCSGHPIACPVRIAAAVLLSLRDIREISDTPLATVPQGSKWRWTWSAKITTALCLTTRNVVPKLGLYPEDISKWATTAPLCSSWEALITTKSNS